MVATLSTGETYTVTGQATYVSTDGAVLSTSGSGSGGVFSGAGVGTANITASFGPSDTNKATAGAALSVGLVGSVTTAEVASMSLSVSSVLYGLVNASFDSTLAVTFDDGTHYSDLHDTTSGLGVAGAGRAMVAYATDVAAAVTIGTSGELTLRDNHHSLVTLSATTACAPTVSATATTAPNLQVPFRGVDLGANNALQFSVSGGGTTVDVPVVVNVQGGHRLKAFQIYVDFDSDLLRATGYTDTVGGGTYASVAFGGPTVALNSPINQAKIVGNKVASVAPTGLVQLATISLQLQSGASGVSLIGGQVIGLVTCYTCDPANPDDDTTTGLGDVTDGAGYVALSGRRARRLATWGGATNDGGGDGDGDGGGGGGDGGGEGGNHDQPLLALPARRELAASRLRRRRMTHSPEGTCCAGAVASGTFFGDVNGDCHFDVNDVARASDLLLLQSGTAVPTSYLGASLCGWQRAQLDPTLDGEFKQNDAVYLLQVLLPPHPLHLTFAPVLSSILSSVHSPHHLSSPL